LKWNCQVTFIFDISVASRAEPVSENIFDFGITLNVFMFYFLFDTLKIDVHSNKYTKKLAKNDSLLIRFDSRKSETAAKKETVE
jgi:hypothetical protein